MLSVRAKTALAFIDDFETLDVPTMISRRTSDCIHSFLPSSMAKSRGLLPKDNAAFTAHINRLREVMPTFPVTPKEVMEDENKNLVIVHATSQAHFYEELKDDGIPAEEWEYQGEYIFMVTTDESGEKIRKIEEFVDSLGSMRLLGLMKRARENKEKAAKSTFIAP